MSKSRRPLRSRSNLQVLQVLSEALCELDERGYEFNGTVLSHAEDGDMVGLSALKTDGPAGAPNVSVSFTCLTWNLDEFKPAGDEGGFWFRGVYYTRSQFAEILRAENG